MLGKASDFPTSQLSISCSPGSKHAKGKRHYYEYSVPSSRRVPLQTASRLLISSCDRYDTKLLTIAIDGPTQARLVAPLLLRSSGQLLINGELRVTVRTLFGVLLDHDGELYSLTASLLVQSSPSPCSCAYRRLPWPVDDAKVSYYVCTVLRRRLRITVTFCHSGSTKYGVNTTVKQ